MSGPRKRTRRREPSATELVQGIREGDITRLARAITFAESMAPRHRSLAQEVLQQVLPETGKSIRLGLTGVPGAGKSTFIEALGMMLCERGHKLAVLAVDPSSSRSGGSILGDKTRMEELSRHPQAFIRPSPAGKSLGGVAAKTREALLLCEAAGFDMIIVETVGVGQSETAVRDLTDFFLLLQIAGGGDDLQGIKKGVIELADAIVVNKADGDNVTRAQRARGEYAQVFRYLQPFTPGWKPRAMTCSAAEKTGIPEVWEMILEFRKQLSDSGQWENRRREQNRDWFRALLREAVLDAFFDKRKTVVSELERQVAAGELPVAKAVETALFHEPGNA